MRKKLRIAMFCTNEWPTPPPQDTFYAPLWIAQFVAEGLSARGHRVDYFGARGSRVAANLVHLGMPALKQNRQLEPYLCGQNESVVNFYEQLMISEIYRRANRGQYDLIHIHPYRRAIQYAPLTGVPTVFTLHDPIDGFRRYLLQQTAKQPHTYLVSISNAQRRPAPRLNYIATVYNGLRLDKYRFNATPKNYFVAAGRFVPEKGIDIAVRVAAQARVKLRLAGGQARGKYWDQRIKPYLGARGTQYVGMLKYYQMGDFYRQGKALLYPLRWEEPFGLVIAEAMACGTPVISFPHGSVPELVKNGVTGYIVKTIPEMVRAVKKIDTLDRAACRAWVERKFSTEKMVDGYEQAFNRIVGQQRKRTA
ncbi:MAG: glycosyltransferase family 4 protein [Patescibacteria group bacterium]|nr:glycosyltransferase family 4 protein [Patescibacteria group bacterium]